MSNLPAAQWYLRPDVKLEPLVCGWYAWSHLLAPPQLGLHLAFRLLPLLESFVEHPALHLSAASDPEMYGGPFVTLADSDIPAVCALAEHTREAAGELLAFAQALRHEMQQLHDRATGHSLDSLYGDLPPQLAGLVEFLYDVDNQPHLRFFERMVQHAYPVAHLQSIMLRRQPDADRHFFMSTPRLASGDALMLPMAFGDRRLDHLAAARTQAVDPQALAELLGVAPGQQARFASLFTQQAPGDPGSRRYVGDGVRVRFFGHACVLVETDELVILFDPFLAMEEGTDGRFTLNDLPERIDFVVLTHGHQDHFSIEMLLQIRGRIGRIVVPANNTGCVCDPSMKIALQELGFDAIDVLGPMDVLPLTGGTLTSLPFTGEHADLNIHSKHAIALQLKKRTLLFLVDSDGRDVVLYERLKRHIGDVDAVFIGMECVGAPLNWLYEPLLPRPVSRRNNESRRLSGADSARAAAIVGALAPRRVFVYAMGQDPWMKYIMGLNYAPDSVQLSEADKLISLCHQHDTFAERPASGREIELS